MDQKRLKAILRNVKHSRLPIGEALNSLRHLPYEDLGFAKLDTHRALRKGFPEVIFCQGMPFSADALAAAVARQTGAEGVVPPGTAVQLRFQDEGLYLLPGADPSNDPSNA